MEMEYMVIAVVAAAIIIALSIVSKRLGIAPPLILMLVGVGISFLPMVPAISIEPEIILGVVLPPLLYAAAIAIPTVELRRDFVPVGGLAIILVVVSAVVVGFVLHWLLGVNLALGIAMGAILSPTDAAATTIVKRLGVPDRVGTILQGESLLNDATALVLLRSAIAATATTVSLWQVAGNFAWAALAATVIGALVGWGGVRLRALVKDTAAATAISFLLPFAAYIPAELLHASGLVSVVAAGLVTAQVGPKHLSAAQRTSEHSNWHTLEFLLEGGVFFLMGLQVFDLVQKVVAQGDSLWTAAGLAGLAMVITLVVRAIYLAFLVKTASAQAHRQARVSMKWTKARDAMTGKADDEELQRRIAERREQMRARIASDDPRANERRAHGFEHLKSHVKRYIADMEYLMRQPLGPKEGTLLTWAGMRGVVTLAAAQTLPWSVPHRSLLILIAFVVAAGSLLLQGGTLAWVVKLLGLQGQDSAPEGEWESVQSDLVAAVGRTKVDQELVGADAELAAIRAKRDALLELRSTGSYSARTLTTALAELDSEEIAITLRQSAEE
ncbi:MAG: sodium:proton antiporter [Propionibacteriaceae bacterium]|jgi:CPA1 family monovalent cation:H+ antiporter|nr:sodium:proton antiporter [Propionibacteriaceae bacterium]